MLKLTTVIGVGVLFSLVMVASSSVVRRRDVDDINEDIDAQMNKLRMQISEIHSALNSSEFKATRERIQQGLVDCSKPALEQADQILKSFSTDSWKHPGGLECSDIKNAYIDTIESLKNSHREIMESVFEDEETILNRKLQRLAGRLEPNDTSKDALKNDPYEELYTVYNPMDVVQSAFSLIDAFYEADQENLIEWGEKMNKNYAECLDRAAKWEKEEKY